MTFFSTILSLILTLSPAAQGQFVRIAFEAPGSPKTVQIEAFGKSLPCYPAGDQIECLAAIPTDTVPQEQTFKILAGAIEIGTAKIRIEESKFPEETLALTQEKKDLMMPSEKRAAEVKTIRAGLGAETTEKFWKGKFIKPVNGKTESLFGEKRILDGKMMEGYYHKGLDIGAKPGTPVLASNAGRVVIARKFIEEGNMAAVDHGHGVVSIYLHCSSLSVKEGQKVKKGQELGKVGSTGVSNSPHVHWGIYIHDIPIDPLYWLQNAP